jgi:putative photosynthetic complex assembly protein
MDESTTMKRLAGPRLPVLAMAALVATALIGAAGVRLSGMNISEPDAPTSMTRTLRFADRADGSIDVTDASTGKLVQRIEGQQGFVRGTLRGLARERRARGIGSEAPFELLARTDGRLTLLDPATGRRVDLESFGPVNSAEFARLLGPAR